LFNKIRFENKINIEMWGSFETLESYVGERVHKIIFVGSINKEIRFREVVSTYDEFWVKKREKTREEKRQERLRFSANFKVRTSLAFQFY